jgi:hypothetical protein
MHTGRGVRGYKKDPQKLIKKYNNPKSIDPLSRILAKV